MPLTNDYLLVNEAADLLGVSPNTIRNWGRDGKITEYRHAVNNYRLFKRTELERIRYIKNKSQHDALDNHLHFYRKKSCLIRRVEPR